MKKDGKEIVIPPSPNWYLSNVFECHRKTGVLAYAASRCLVFVWPTEPNGEISFPQTRVVPDAHMNKVTCKQSFFLIHLIELMLIIYYFTRCLLVRTLRG